MAFRQDCASQDLHNAARLYIQFQDTSAQWVRSNTLNREGNSLTTADTHGDQSF